MGKIEAQPSEVRTQPAALTLTRCNDSAKTMAKSSESGNSLDALMQHYRNLIANERNAKVRAELEARLAQIIAEAGYE